MRTSAPYGVFALAAWLTILAAPAAAQAPPAASPADAAATEFARGIVVEVVDEREVDLAGFAQLVQIVMVRLTSGTDAGMRVPAEHATVATPDRSRLVRPGETVVVAKSLGGGDQGYYVVDRYRLRPMFWVLALFVGLAVLLSRLRGVTSVLGLGITVLVLTKFVVPQIIAGANPLAISLLGSLVIAIVSTYFAHGFSQRTTIAVVATLLTLGASAALAVGFVEVTKLFGAGTEEAFYLQLGPLEALNLRGLLLGGIILGALGVLDDITTSQAAAIDEIRRANPALSPRELYRRGLSVGTEHITALVNTLFLAYAGASLPLFLLFTINVDQPLWVIVNSEFVAEEVVRTLVGSIALILAVPVTTLLAAAALGAKPASVTSP